MDHIVAEWEGREAHQRQQPQEEPSPCTHHIPSCTLYSKQDIGPPSSPWLTVFQWDVSGECVKNSWSRNCTNTIKIHCINIVRCFYFIWADNLIWGVSSRLFWQYTHGQNGTGVLFLVTVHRPLQIKFDFEMESETTEKCQEAYVLRNRGGMFLI